MLIKELFSNVIDNSVFRVSEYRPKYYSDKVNETTLEQFRNYKPKYGNSSRYWRRPMLKNID